MIHLKWKKWFIGFVIHRWKESNNQPQIPSTTNKQTIEVCSENGNAELWMFCFAINHQQRTQHRHSGP